MSDPSSFGCQEQSCNGKERKPKLHHHSYKGPYDKNESKHVCNNGHGKVSTFSLDGILQSQNVHESKRDQSEEMPYTSASYPGDALSYISIVKKERDDENSGGFQEKYSLIADHNPYVEFSSSEINNNKITTEDMELDRNANEYSNMIAEDLTKSSVCIAKAEYKPDISRSPFCDVSKDVATNDISEGIIDPSHLKQMYQCEFCQIVTVDEPEMMSHLEQKLHSSASLVYATPGKTVVYLKQTSFLKFEQALFQKIAARCPYKFCRGILSDVGACETHVCQYNTPIKCTKYYLADVHSRYFVQIDIKNNKCDKCSFQGRVPYLLFRHYLKTTHKPFLIAKGCDMYTACTYCHYGVLHFTTAMSHVRKFHSQENVGGKLKLLVFFLKRTRRLVELPPYSLHEDGGTVCFCDDRKNLCIRLKDKPEELTDIGLLKELYQCEFCQTMTDNKVKMISHLTEELHSSASLVLATAEETVVYIKQTSFLKTELAALKKFAAICSNIDCNRILKDVAACEHHIDLYCTPEKNYGYWIAEVFLQELVQIDIKKDICDHCKCHGGSPKGLFTHYVSKDYWPFNVAQDCDMFFACTYCTTTFLLYHEAVHHIRQMHECDTVDGKLNLLVLFLNQERKMVKLPPYAPGKAGEVNYMNTKIKLLTEKECKNKFEWKWTNVVKHALRCLRNRLQ